MKILSFEELQRSLAKAKNHPEETGWDIYRYMKANMEAMNSQEARTLLACYMKMGLPRPSLLHSLMLNIALRMAKKFPDFQFDRFFDMWEYPGIERIIGYVDYYDEQRGFYHIYDKLSRHFVAIHPHITPMVGGFVEFTPIIPKDSKFKTAVVHMSLGDEHTENGKRALKEFGTVQAVVTNIDNNVGLFEYKIISPIPTSPEGIITETGKAYNDVHNVAVGQSLTLIILLKRGKDGVKRNYVAKLV